MDARLKWLVTFWGFVLLLPGLMALAMYCCLATATFSYPMYEDPQALAPDVGVAAILAAAAGGGGVHFYHGMQSEAKRPSQPLRLPPLWALAGAFPLLVALALGAQQSSSGVLFLFPAPVIAAALIPPVAVLAWMVNGQPGTLTWRRASVAFVAGATVCVGLAFALELILLGLGGFALDRVGEHLETLAGLEIARALPLPGLMVALVALAPLVEEMVKPLVTLPLLPHLKSRREALLLGAVAGAGFAAMENVIYLMAGLPVWVAVMALRTLGAAVHPLCAGLVTVGWFRVLRREPGSDIQWLEGYGQAVGIHALWNGGCVLLLSWGGVRFLGALRPDLGALSVTVVGGVLAFVAAGVVARREVTPSGRQVLERVLGELSKDQAMAVWAVACAVVLLPAGLAVLEGVR
jgi:RsiW-degrading membrane proteinase PrsW (M82 family)